MSQENEKIKMILVTTEETRERLRTEAANRATTMSGLINLFVERGLENIGAIYAGEPTQETKELETTSEVLDTMSLILEELEDVKVDLKDKATLDSMEAVIRGFAKSQDKEPEPMAKAAKKGDSKADKEKKERAKEAKEETEALFDEFWEVYPRRVGRKRARQRWNAMKVDKKLFREIMKGLNLYLKYVWKEKEVGFIPYPTTWLNQERWKDEIAGTGEHIRAGSSGNATGGKGTTGGVIGNIAGGKKQP